MTRSWRVSATRSTATARRRRDGSAERPPTASADAPIEARATPGRNRLYTAAYSIDCHVNVTNGDTGSVLSLRDQLATRMPPFAVSPAAERLRDKSNANADWSDAGPRLAPQAWPAFAPRFIVPAAGTVFTIGSCFARNIEEHVARLGFRVPTLAFAVPEAERAGGRGNAVLNKYTPAAIRQEFEWTRQVLEAGGTVRPEHVAPLAFTCTDGNQIDLQLGGFRAVSPERLLARRQELFDVVRHAFTADCVVLTLGLVEAFVDETTGLAIQQAPVQPAFRRSLSRFTFRRLDFAACRAAVQASIDTVRAVNPAATFLITTSPVPLDRTFTDEDVITATMYGKSVLRAVCGEIVAANERVDYFPSYESVMLTRDWSVFQSDRRHVADGFVGKIVQRLVDTYFREAPIDRRMAHAAYMASLAGEAADAGALRSLWEAAPQDVRAFVHYLNSLAAAPEELAAAVARHLEAKPQPASLVRIGRTAKRDLEQAAAVLGALAAGVETAAAGGALAADYRELWVLWVQALMREERFAEALKAARDAVGRWPDDAEAIQLLSVAERRSRRAGIRAPTPEAEPDMPPPLRALASALDAGDDDAVAAATNAALDAGTSAADIVRAAYEAKRAGQDGIVAPRLAALVGAVAGRDGAPEDAFVQLWRMWAQTLMREGHLADAVAAVADAGRRWPDDETLTAFAAQVRQKARRAGVDDAAPAVFDPTPPPPSPAEALAAALGTGDAAAVTTAATAAVDAGAAAAEIVAIAQQAKRAAENGVVSPGLAALVDTIGGRHAAPDVAFFPLWRLLSQALWREDHRTEAHAVAAAAATLWPDDDDAVALLDAMTRKLRKHGAPVAPSEPAADAPEATATPRAVRTA